MYKYSTNKDCYHCPNNSSIASVGSNAGGHDTKSPNRKKKLSPKEIRVRKDSRSVPTQRFKVEVDIERVPAKPLPPAIQEPVDSTSYTGKCGEVNFRLSLGLRSIRQTWCNAQLHSHFQNIYSCLYSQSFNIYVFCN